MKNKYYIRIQENTFGFVVEGIHKIDETTDHAIAQEEYNKFFELQSEGKQFRVKEVPTGTSLFDLIEEYIPPVIEIPYEPSLSEKNRADIDYIAIMTGVEL